MISSYEAEQSGIIKIFLMTSFLKKKKVSQKNIHFLVNIFNVFKSIDVIIIFFLYVCIFVLESL